MALSTKITAALPLSASHYNCVLLVEVNVKYADLLQGLCTGQTRQQFRFKAWTLDEISQIFGGYGGNNGL